MAKIFDVDFKKGSLIDAVTKTAPTIAGSGILRTTEKGNAYYSNKSVSNYLLYTGADVASVNAKSFSVSAMVKINSFSDGAYQCIFEKGTASNNRYYMFIHLSTGKALFGKNSDGSPSYYVGTSDLRDGKWHHIIGIYNRSTNNIKIYVDGVLEGNYNSIPTSNITSGNLSVGRDIASGTFPIQGHIGFLRIWNEVITDKIISKEQQNFLKASNLALPKKNIRKTNEEISNDELNLLDGFQFVGDKASKIQSTKGLPMVSYGKAILTKDGLKTIQADSSYVQCPTFTMGGRTTVTIEGVFQCTAGIIDGFGEDTDTNNKWYFGYGADNRPYFLLNTAYGYVNSAINDGKVHHYVLVFNGTATGNANRMQMYIDGVLQSLTFNGTIIANFNASFTNKFYVGRIRTTAYQYSTAEFNYLKFYSNAFTAAQATKAYQNYAKQVYLSDRNIDAPADGSAIKLTGLAPGSGNFKVGEITTADTVLPHIGIGSKYLENLSLQQIALYPSVQAYGTWEFDMYIPSGGYNQIDFISNGTTFRSSGYEIQFDGANRRVIVYRTTGGGTAATLLQTATSYIAYNTRYRMRIVRTIGGVFTVYIKGGSFGNIRNLVSAAGGAGTNPFTDTTYTASVNFAPYLRETGCRIGNIKLSQGILS